MWGVQAAATAMRTPALDLPGKVMAALTGLQLYHYGRQYLAIACCELGWVRDTLLAPVRERMVTASGGSV